MQEPQANAGIIGFAAYVMRYYYDAVYSRTFAHALGCNQK